MKTALFDIETNGLKATTVFCMTVIEAESGDEFRFKPNQIHDGCELLRSAHRTVAHNGIGFDYRVLSNTYGLVIPENKALDSLVLSRVLCGQLKEVDLDAYLRNKDSIPGKLIGRHGIEAWGWRLGLHKGDYAAEMKARGLDPWAEYSEEMDEYCANDTRVLLRLWNDILSPHIGNKIYSFRTTVNFSSAKLKRDCNVTLPEVILPDNAYDAGVPRIPMGKTLVDMAKESGALDKSILTSLSRVSFLGVPSFLNANFHDPLPSANPGGRRASYASSLDSSKPATSAKSYAQKLATATYAQDFHFRHIVTDDADGKLFIEALRSFSVQPTVKTTPMHVIELEHYMARRMEEQRASGILFDVANGRKMLGELRSLSSKLEHDLRRKFPPVVKIKEIKSRSKIREFDFAVGSLAAALQQKVAPRMIKTYVPFKVSSRKQVGERLLNAGWKPDFEDRTKTGQVKVSDDVLGKARQYFIDHGQPDFAQAVEDIRTFYLVQKRIGQLAGGEQAWLKLADSRNFIHPTIVPCAAVTARATHSSPNVSQVPALVMVKKSNPDFVFDDAARKLLEEEIALLGPDDKKRLKEIARLTAKTVEVVGWGREGEWGADSRKLFIVPKGFKQVGADLSGIELRMLAHYLWKWDKGRFANILLTQDVHEVNRKIIGFANRTDAKRFIFALLYGAGDVKLGSIVMPSGSLEQQKAVGRQFRDKTGSGIIGFAELVSELRQECKTGKIKAIDGRSLPIRSDHAALNTLLQSAGTGILPKYWIKNIFDEVEKRGYQYGYDFDYTFLLWSHDEVQFAVREPYAEEFATIFTDAALLAGNQLGILLPTAAEAKIGNNWFDCH